MFTIQNKCVKYLLMKNEVPFISGTFVRI